MPESVDHDVPHPTASSPKIGCIEISSEPIGFNRSDVPSSLSPVTPLLGDSLYNSQNDGFDVMDFLDSILNDGSTGQEESDKLPMPGDLLSAASHNAPVLANPWASEGKSRAAAYGISFDDSEGDTEREESSPVFGVRASPSVDGIASVPLLTPAAILSAYDDEDDEDQGTSFYASLMRE